MARAQAGDFKVGDIVKLVQSANQLLIGSLGEVVDLGPPLRIAILHVLPFAARQLKKEVDLTELSWNELRAYAKGLEVPAVGTRPELEARIRESLKYRGRAESGALNSSRPSATRGQSFEIGDIVRVTDPQDEHFGFEGEVVPGPNFTVEVVKNGFELQPPKRYDADQLVKTS